MLIGLARTYPSAIFLIVSLKGPTAILHNGELYGLSEIGIRGSEPDLGLANAASGLVRNGSTS